MNRISPWRIRGISTVLVIEIVRDLEEELAARVNGRLHSSLWVLRWVLRSDHPSDDSY